MDFLYRRKSQNSQNVNDEDDESLLVFSFFFGCCLGWRTQEKLSGAILLRDATRGIEALLSRETRARNAVQLIELIRRSSWLVYEHRLGSVFFPPASATDKLDHNFSEEQWNLPWPLWSRGRITAEIPFHSTGSFS
jgi:hypothetical protein